MNTKLLKQFREKAHRSVRLEKHSNGEYMIRMGMLEWNYDKRVAKKYGKQCAWRYYNRLPVHTTFTAKEVQEQLPKCYRSCIMIQAVFERIKRAKK